MKTHLNLFAVGSLVFALLAPTRATAADLFNLTATGGPSTVSVGSSDLLNLVDKAVKNSAEFSVLAGEPVVNARLTYQGVANALRFNLTDSGVPGAARFQAQLTSQVSTSLNEQFHGSTRDELFNNLEDWFKREGSAAYTRLLKDLSAQSKVSPTDGNPGAATARSSFQNYTEYSSTMTETREEKEQPKDLAGRAGFGLVADVGIFDSKGIKGTAYSLPLFAKFKLSERVGLNFNIPLSYTEIESAKVFGVGLAIGVPVKVILKKKDNPWFWQVTPFGAGNAVGSKEIVTGGLIVNGGIGSVVSYDFGNFELSMGNQFGQYESIALEFDGVKVDPGVAQKIVKNGLKVGIPFAKRWVFEAYAVHTKFLEAAGVDQYITTGGEIGYRFLGKPDAAKKKNGYMKLGLYTDIGNGYFSPHIQFGSGWKF